MDGGIIDYRFLAKSIGQLNPPAPVIMPETGSITQALNLLKQNKIGCVVAVNATGTISGIFSERDVVLRSAWDNPNWAQQTLREVMTTEPQTTSMTTSIAVVLNMMSRGGYRHVPIVDDENIPVGVVSVKNVVDYIVSTLAKDFVSFR